MPSGRLFSEGFLKLELAMGYDEFAYEIASGRREWPNRDPKGIEGGINLYRYCGNGPVNLFDPWGLEAGYFYHPDGSMSLRIFQDPEGNIAEWIMQQSNMLFPSLVELDEMTGGPEYRAVLDTYFSWTQQNRASLPPFIQSLLAVLDETGGIGIGVPVGVVKVKPSGVRPPTSGSAPARATAKSKASLARNTLPMLDAAIERSAFEGAARTRTFKAGDRVYRSPWPDESAKTPGARFGTRETVTTKGTDSQYNIVKWSNPNEKLRIYEFKEEVTVYYGRVKGGTGYQLLFPQDVVPGDVLTYVGEHALRP